MSLWKKYDLDNILIKGYQLYENVNKTKYLNVVFLSDKFQLVAVQIHSEYGNKCYNLLELNKLLPASTDVPSCW